MYFYYFYLAPPLSPVCCFLESIPVKLSDVGTDDLEDVHDIPTDGQTVKTKGSTGIADTLGNL